MPSLMAGVDGLRHGTPLTSPAAEDWLNEHSRADLSELLLKADELIKDRENGTYSNTPYLKIKSFEL